MSVPFTISEERRWPQTKAGIVWEMGPFQKLSKLPFHKAWHGYSIEPGCQPSMALIYYCQTVCCVYLPRLTNWTFVGLAALPENWSFCYLLQESFHGMCQKLDLSDGWFPSSVQGAFFFSGTLLLLLLLVLFVFDVFYIVCSVPAQSRYLDWTRRKFTDPWWDQRGSQKGLHGDFLPGFSHHALSLSFCPIGKGSFRPADLKVWSQEQHRSPLEISEWKFSDPTPELPS